MRTSNRLPILLDMDNVLMDLEAAMVSWLFRRNRPDLVEVMQRRTDHHFKADSEEDDALIGEMFNSPEFWMDIPVMEGAIEGVQRMVQSAARIGRHVMIVTAPHYGCPGSLPVKLKHAELFIQSGFKMDHLVMTRDKTVVRGVILVDDAPKPYGDVLTPQWKHVVFSQPFNLRNLQALGKHRMPDWSPRSVDLVLELSERVDPQYR